jgi:hypothetical protein
MKKAKILLLLFWAAIAVALIYLFKRLKETNQAIKA